MRSFDIFDTLIARRCIEPHGIFRAVELRSGLVDFFNQRIEAERRLCETNYTLDDIYAQLQSISGVDDARVSELKGIEIDEELKNVIPIQENISQLHDGDILVSDMYLSQEIIGRLLGRAGCGRETPIIVTSHGKSRGHIWPVLKQHLDIDFHTGDNLHSDIQSARAHGIEARHTQVAKLNTVETFLMTVGLHQLCQLLRELRLSQHDENPLVRNWQQMQCQFNIPLLVLSSIHIVSECERLQRTKVQFSSRDCYFLKRIFDSLNCEAREIASAYFYTSRIARVSRSEDYARYVRTCVTGESLIVDLCGTGWSLGAMLENAGVTAPFFLVHDVSDGVLTSHYSNIRKVHSPHDRSFLLKGADLNNSVFEKFNYVDHGSIIDVKHIPEVNQFIPLQQEPDYPPEIRLCIQTTEALVDQFDKICGSYDMPALISEAMALGDHFKDVFRVLYEHAVENASFTSAFAHYHTAEDARVFARLNSGL